MFTYEGTFIIAFSVSKKHFSVALENVAIEKFRNEIDTAGYEATNQLFRIKIIHYKIIHPLNQLNSFNKKKNWFVII